MTHWEWLVNFEELIGKGEFDFFGVPLKFKAARDRQFAPSPW